LGREVWGSCSFNDLTHIPNRSRAIPLAGAMATLGLHHARFASSMLDGLRSRFFCCAVSILTAAMSTCVMHANAQEASARTARVEVESPSGCSSSAIFWKALGRRTERVVPTATNAAPDARIEVLMRTDQRAGSGVVGELTIVRGATRSQRRRIVGASCEEVTQGLSLVAALAFDPAARMDDAAPTPTTTTPTNNVGSSSSSTTTATTTTTTTTTGAAPVPSASVEPTRRDASAAETPTPTPPTPATTPSHWRWGMGASGSVSALGTTSAVLAYGGFIDLESESDDRASRLAPSFRVGAAHSEGFADGAQVSADLAWTYARASACPLRFDLGSRNVAFRPCAGVDAGVLSARAVRLDRTKDRSRPWIMPHAVARLSWAPVRILFVEVQGGLGIPVVRDELVVDPTVSVYRAPALVPIAEIGAGLHFP
jgi:hypothetical protein